MSRPLIVARRWTGRDSEREQTLANLYPFGTTRIIVPLTTSDWIFMGGAIHRVFRGSEPLIQRSRVALRCSIPFCSPNQNTWRLQRAHISPGLFAVDVKSLLLRAETRFIAWASFSTAVDKSYLDGRYVCHSEPKWRITGFHFRNLWHLGVAEGDRRSCYVGGGSRIGPKPRRSRKCA